MPDDHARPAAGRGAAWMAAIRLALAIGCVVSACGTGRFCLRVIVDGALSFAFVPAFQVAALGLACRTRGGPRGSFADLAARFLASNTPWFVWMALVAGVFAVVPPQDSAGVFVPTLASGAVPLVWSAVIDARFFRDALDGDGRAAWRAVVVQRAVAWGASLTYFFGIAAWHEYVRPALGWLHL